MFLFYKLSFGDHPSLPPSLSSWAHFQQQKQKSCIQSSLQIPGGKRPGLSHLNSSALGEGDFSRTRLGL